MSTLFELQKKLKPVTKNAKGFNYKYADLPYLWEQVAPVLEEMGLAVTNNCDGEFIITSIVDKEGKLVGESKLPINYAKTQSPQDLGSAVTYFRRYNLLMLLNIIVEDDDGKKAQDNIKKEVESPF